MQWADTLELYARQPYWNPFEAACLLLGKDPKYIKSSRISDMTGTLIECSAMQGGGLSISALQDIITRAIEVNELSQKPKPKDVLEWAKKMGIAIDQKIIAAVTKLNADSGKDSDMKIAELEKEIEELKERLKSVDQQKPSSDGDINGRNRSTLLWIVSVCLHKAFKSDFVAKDEGYTLAQKLIQYGNNNGLKPKSKNTLQSVIQEAREAIEVVQEVIDETKHHKFTASEKV